MGLTAPMLSAYLIRSIATEATIKVVTHAAQKRLRKNGGNYRMEGGEEERMTSP